MDSISPPHLTWCRGVASVIISIVFLTSIVQSGLPFTVFPHALTINGFTDAVMGATLGPALIGECLRRTMAKNLSLLSINVVDFNPYINPMTLDSIFSEISLQALVVSMKEIYGWLLIIALVSLLLILVAYGPMRPLAIFPKWSTIRRILKHLVRTSRQNLGTYRNL